MTLDGPRTCPHCRAIAQATICSICGKSSYEEIEPKAPRRRLRWWQKPDVRAQTRPVAMFAGVALLGGLTIWIVTRPDPPPDPAALPAPAATTTTTTTTPGRAPSVEAGERPGAPSATTGIEAGADREVGLDLDPWEDVPPIDFVTGRFLDPEDDFGADIARVAEILDAFPRVLALGPVAEAEILTFGGPIDLGVTEATQPFAARTLSTEFGPVGEIWLIASGGSDAGNAYLAAARTRWDVAEAVDQFVPEPGLRVWKLGEDETTQMWAADLDDSSLVIVQVPVQGDPSSFAAAIGAWRANLP